MILLQHWAQLFYSIKIKGQFKDLFANSRRFESICFSIQYHSDDTYSAMWRVSDEHYTSLWILENERAQASEIIAIKESWALRDILVSPPRPFKTLLMNKSWKNVIRIWHPVLINKPPFTKATPFTNFADKRKLAGQKPTSKSEYSGPISSSN